MKKRFSLLILSVFALLLVATPVFASQICNTASGCTSAEVGVFMKGISQGCGNTGDCSIDDIMLVFYNVGNYVLAIIGGLVLVMYIIGGLYLITAGGRPDRVKSGVKYLTTSTIGLLIVLFAFAGVKTLESAIRGGGATLNEDGVVYVTCGPGEVNHGEVCGDNQKCDHGLCLTECEIVHPTYSVGIITIGEIWNCVNTDQPENTSLNCEENYCPGAENIQCCDVTERTP